MIFWIVVYIQSNFHLFIDFIPAQTINWNHIIGLIIDLDLVGFVIRQELMIGGSDFKEKIVFYFIRCDHGYDLLNDALVTRQMNNRPFSRWINRILLPRRDAFHLNPVRINGKPIHLNRPRIVNC